MRWSTSPNSIGVSSGGRGSTHMFFEDAPLPEIATFNDSPARADGQEREDASTYPTGHWLNYPYSSIFTSGEHDFTLSLAVRPKPTSSCRAPTGRLAP
jgi:hypothetical protein